MLSCVVHPYLKAEQITENLTFFSSASIVFIIQKSFSEKYDIRSIRLVHTLKIMFPEYIIAASMKIELLAELQSCVGSSLSLCEFEGGSK